MVSDVCWIPFDLMEAFMIDGFKGIGTTSMSFRGVATVKA